MFSKEMYKKLLETEGIGSVPADCPHGYARDAWCLKCDGRRNDGDPGDSRSLVSIIEGVAKLERLHRLKSS